MLDREEIEDLAARGRKAATDLQKVDGRSGVITELVDVLEALTARMGIEYVVKEHPGEWTSSVVSDRYVALQIQANLERENTEGFEVVPYKRWTACGPWIRVDRL